jgi:hypothetical protein
MESTVTDRYAIASYGKRAQVPFLVEVFLGT